MERVLNSTVLVISHTGNDLHAARNINFTVKHYLEQMPGMTAAVIEQNREPGLEAGVLPGNCRYQFLKSRGRHGRGRAFNAGFEMFEASKEFFILTDSSIFIEPIDLKPNLLMCAKHDFASSFRQLYDLTEDDTLKCLSGDFRWRGLSVSHPLNKLNLCSSCCIFSNKALRMAGPWKETGKDADEQMSRRVRSVLGSFYESPNQARRLRSS